MPDSDKLLMLGDFNARVGYHKHNDDVWVWVIMESGWRGVLKVLWHQSVIYHEHLVSEETTLRQLDTSWYKV